MNKDRFCAIVLFAAWVILLALYLGWFELPDYGVIVPAYDMGRCGVL